MTASDEEIKLAWLTLCRGDGITTVANLCAASNLAPLIVHELLDGWNEMKLISVWTATDGETYAATIDTGRKARQDRRYIDPTATPKPHVQRSRKSRWVLETDGEIPLDQLADTEAEDPHAIASAIEEIEKHRYPTGGRIADKWLRPDMVARWPRPIVLLSGSSVWDGKKRKGRDCPACKGLPLSSWHFCLRCDRWGGDFMFAAYWRMERNRSRSRGHKKTTALQPRGITRANKKGRKAG